MACSKAEPPPPTTSPSSAAPAPAASATLLDLDAFCETTMEVDRTCAGDDELSEGNKVGLCVTTLRAARDDDGAELLREASLSCLAEVNNAKGTLPDIRTLRTLAERFASCRTFLRVVPSLAEVEAKVAGAAPAGEPCTESDDCVKGSFCAQQGHRRVCAPVKKAGEPCRESAECLGRCSRAANNTCVSYCSSG